MRDSRRELYRMSKRHSYGRAHFEKQADEELTTTEELPENLENRAKELLSDGEEIKVSLSTDLRFDGNYGKELANCYRETPHRF